MPSWPRACVRKPNRPERPRLLFSCWLLAGMIKFALDSIGNSLFTSFIKAVWSEGRFQGDYKTFLAEIARRVTTMAPAQEPQLFTSGAFHG